MKYFLNEIIGWFYHNSYYGTLVADTAIGVFAIWEGIILIAENRMKPYQHLTKQDKKHMFWNKVIELNVIILPMVILSFVIGVILQYIQISNPGN